MGAFADIVKSIVGAVRAPEETPRIVEIPDDPAPRPEWVLSSPPGSCSFAPAADPDRVWESVPGGDAGKALRKSIAAESGLETLLANLPSPGDDTSVTLRYWAGRGTMLESWYLLAYRVFGNETLRGEARIRQGDAVLLSALRRCALDKEQLANGNPLAKRYVPTWRKLSSAASVLEFLQGLDHLYRDVTGNAIEYSWDQAPKEARDAADLLGRLRPVLTSSENIRRARAVIIKYLSTRKMELTLTRFSELPGDDAAAVKQWEHILDSASAATRMISLAAPDSGRSASSTSRAATVGFFAARFPPLSAKL